jgi:hypothetical protein
MGYHPRANITLFPNTLPGVETWIAEWTQARQQVHKAILITQKRWVHTRYLGRTLKIGDKVWLEGRNLRTEQPTAKLVPKRHGPFLIKKVLSPITYQLTLPLTWKIHDVFHVDLLTPYIKTDFHGPNYTRPPPDLINDKEEYEVEQVLSSRHHGKGCKVQYLVKWKGYPDSDNKWVNWDDMHAEEALEDFRKQNPRAITHIRKTQSTAEIPTPTLHSWIYSNKSMSQDAICTTLPYAQCESPVPEAGVQSPLPTTTISYARPTDMHPPTLIQTGDGTRLGMQSTALNPRAGGPPLNPPLNPLIALQPVLPKILIPTFQGTRNSPFPKHLLDEPEAPLIHDSLRSLSLNPPPQQTTSPLTPLPSPPPHVPLPHYQSLCSSTIWGPYLIKHGGYAKDLKSLDPTLQGQEATSISTDSGAEVQGGHQLANTDTNGRTETDEEDAAPVREAWTPPPEGYSYNLGDYYVPMHIKGPDGHLWPAKFTRVEYTDNLRVCGYCAGSPTPYSDYLYAEPYFDLYRHPRYSKADLWFLSHRYPYRNEVDLGFHALKDHTIKAEVRHYRGLDAKLTNLLYDLQQLVEKDRGFENPEGMVKGYGRVGVRVQMLLPPTNPYPSRGSRGSRGYRRGR